MVTYATARSKVPLTLSRVMFRAKPPRSVLDLTYRANLVAPVTLILYAYTLRMPPVSSLPQVIAPRLPFIVNVMWVMRRWWGGAMHNARPTASAPMQTFW